MTAEIVDIQDARKSLLDWALAYAERGVKIFATTADGKAPSTSNKAWSRYWGRELRKGEGGLNQATTDPEVIRWMFSQRGAGGIGMPCGKVNGVVVLDLDLHKEEADGNAHDVRREMWDEIQEAHTVETRNGGLHVYFQYESGHLKKELGANVEVQSDGAYVLLPPSKGYKVTRHVLREDWPEVPWIPVGHQVKRDTRNDSSGDVPDHIRHMVKLLRDKHNWHDPVRDIVAYLVGCGWSDAEILRYSFQWTWQGYDPRETFEELCVMIEGARAKGWGNQ